MSKRRNICVYAIAKNEAAFVDRFCDAAADADSIAVLDTGSTDDTVERLRKRGCIVERETFDPWRFDAARNRSMELVPRDTDICVCIDLDEVLLPGWRDALETAWTDETVAGRYLHIDSRNPDGSPASTLFQTKVHCPGAMRWKYPVHEILEFAHGFGQVVTIPAMLVEHKPDRNKSRAQYLPLLELAAREMPEDARCAHYLGREYMYHHRWRDAIRELKRHLSLQSATWREERAASMRYLSRCYAGLGGKSEALRWAMLAICEQDALRENWYAAERAAYEMRDWSAVRWFGERAAQITLRSTSCINESDAWGPGVQDLLGLAYWNQGLPEQALACGEAALALSPDDRRLRDNVKYYRAAVK